MRTLAAFVLLALSTAVFAQSEKQISPEQKEKIMAQEAGAWKPQQAKIITVFERDMYEAEKKHDWDAIARRLAPDFLELAGDGKTYNKQQVADAFKDVKLDSYTMSDIQVRALNPSAAVIAYKLEVVASVGGRSLPGAFLVSSAWARVGGAWVMKLHQGTVVPKP